MSDDATHSAAGTPKSGSHAFSRQVLTILITAVATGLVGRFTGMFSPRIEPTDHPAIARAFVNDVDARQWLLNAMKADKSFVGPPGPQGLLGPKGDPSDFAKEVAQKLGARIDGVIQGLDREIVYDMFNDTGNPAYLYKDVRVEWAYTNQHSTVALRLPDDTSKWVANPDPMMLMIAVVAGLNSWTVDFRSSTASADTKATHWRDVQIVGVHRVKTVNK